MFDWYIYIYNRNIINLSLYCNFKYLERGIGRKWKENGE